MGPRAILGFKTGHGPPNGNPRTEGDRKKRPERVGTKGNAGVAALGWLLTGLALGFVGWQLTQDGAWQLAGDRLDELAPAVLLGAIAYAAASFLLAEAWRQLLGADAGIAPARSYHAVYGRTQIIKYLPGNVFHFAGRQIMGRRLGHEQAALALASVAEILLLLMVAAALALPVVLDWVGPTWLSMLAVAMLALAGVGFCLFRFRRALLPLTLPLPRKEKGKLQATEPPSPSTGGSLPSGNDPRGGVRMCSRHKDQASARWVLRRLWRAALLYVAFFVIGGVLLWSLTLSAGGRHAGTPDLAISISALALAWMAGFVTPGSSAGFGVREAVLIMVMQSSLDPKAAVLVALAMRLVTLVGDILFLAASLALPLPCAHSPASSTSID